MKHRIKAIVKPSLTEENLLLLKKIRQDMPSRTLNAQADALHSEAFSKVDCLSCAACCKQLPPVLSGDDCRRIARHLKLGENVFHKSYTTTDNDGDRVMRGAPCPFLGADNLCAIYDIRPEACRQYPHTGDGAFDKQLKRHAVNMQYCPALVYIVKALESVNNKY